MTIITDASASCQTNPYSLLHSKTKLIFFLLLFFNNIYIAVSLLWSFSHFLTDKNIQITNA